MIYSREEISDFPSSFVLQIFIPWTNEIDVDDN
jgi:hypothetical protein